MKVKKLLTTLVLSLVLVTMGSFQENDSGNIYGTYSLKTETDHKNNVNNRIEIRKGEGVYWYVVSKKNDTKEKCVKMGNFILSDDKLVLTWSKNHCDNCGTNLNEYDIECNKDTLLLKGSSLWTKGSAPKEFIKIK